MGGIIAIVAVAIILLIVLKNISPNNSSVFSGMSTAVRDFINKAKAPTPAPKKDNTYTDKQGNQYSGSYDENGNFKTDGGVFLS